VPQLIDGCLKQLDELNQRFHLKDSLEGEKGEIELVNNLMEERSRI